MGSRALLMVKELSCAFLPKSQILSNFNCARKFPQVLHHRNKNNYHVRRIFSTSGSSSLEPLDVPKLAETARISLTPQEVEEFAPKIGQVMEWFGQLQSVDLESVEPCIRAGGSGICSIRSPSPPSQSPRTSSSASPLCINKWASAKNWYKKR